MEVPAPQVLVDRPLVRATVPIALAQALPIPRQPAEALTQWTSNLPTMMAGPKERAGFMEQPVK